MVKALRGIAVVTVLFTTAALAQGTVQIRGKDGTAPHDVAVDSSGRLILSPVTVDGGSTVLLQQCSATSSKDKVTSVGTAMVRVPVETDGGTNDAANRVSILICNSAENSGTPKVKCRMDGTTPVMGTGTAGVTLNVEDCLLSTVPSGVRCISDTAATAVPTFECVP